MAKNRYFEKGDQFSVAVPEGTKSGHAVMSGDRGGVALIDRMADGKATCAFNGAYLFPVVGPVAENGRVYFLNGVLSGDSTGGGKPYGYSLREVANGQTLEVPVKLGS